MRTYTSIIAALNYIPRALRKEEDEGQLLEWALEGYNLLDMRDRHETVAILKQIPTNKKIKLPADLDQVALVTYLKRDPTDSEAQEFQMCAETATTILDPSCFCNTSYYNNCYAPLKYVGNSHINCKYCKDPRLARCKESYIVDKNKNLVSTIESGYLCIIYTRPVKDDNGEYMVLDNERVLRYLGRYATMKAVEERMYLHEEGMRGLYLDAMEQAETALNAAVGSMRLRGLRHDQIVAINGTATKNQQLIYLPKSYYEDNPL